MHCALEFKPKSWTGYNAHAVTGHIYNDKESADKNDKSKSLASLEGKWSDKIDLVMPDGSKELMWQCSAGLERTDWMYNFTEFSLKINNLTDEYKAVLPISDARLRTDLRALENGDFDLAATEKHRLEEKQRAARKWRTENPGNDFVPKYFRQMLDSDTQEQYYAYGAEGCRDYWEDRAKQDFAHMEDIY